MVHSQQTLYVEDCLNTLNRIDTGTIDLVVADPPYYEIYGGFDYAWQNQSGYLKWCKNWLTECVRVLKPSGSMYLWGKIGYGKGYSLFKLCDWLESSTMLTVQGWITQKNCRGRGTRKGFMNAREELVHMTKSTVYTWNPVYLDVLSNRKDAGFNGKPRKNTHMRCSDVWCDISEASQSSKERFKTNDGERFPTVKAIRLCDRIIHASSNAGDLVYIPFAGSGSEIVSCIHNHRSWIASEINGRYANEIILPRICTAVQAVNRNLAERIV